MLVWRGVGDHCSCPTLTLGRCPLGMASSLGITLAGAGTLDEASVQPTAVTQGRLNFLVIAVVVILLSREHVLSDLFSSD